MAVEVTSAKTIDNIRDDSTLKWMVNKSTNSLERLEPVRQAADGSCRERADSRRMPLRSQRLAVVLRR